jgi:plasmid stability protein
MAGFFHIDRKPVIWENSPMKTTLELPDHLMREVKIRAAEEGRKLKELVAELLRRGLDAPLEGAAPVVVDEAEDEESPFVKDPETGLLVVKCNLPSGVEPPGFEDIQKIIADEQLKEDLQGAGISL